MPDREPVGIKRTNTSSRGSLGSSEPGSSILQHLTYLRGEHRAPRGADHTPGGAYPPATGAGARQTRRGLLAGGQRNAHLSREARAAGLRRQRDRPSPDPTLRRSRNYLSRGRGPEREGARRGPLERRARVLLPDGTRLESQPGKAELLPGGALLWEHEGRALLMRTELSKAEAIPLAASVS
jgi:hypothetical protein